ncbi:MAG: bifunctional (p)ppGpp synthetase/guanosine-3',5'-bis(diphosphate) 3'-pyrophosphohydrolase [Gammaproteobacteria bacterium]|nr:bifunctional (p)ppGpp synthetase/guanosine-3',5'-bis(diphosphate) 3'-pyrophosphohydrolase [Gammaproteobacteria bacterium]
MVTSSFCYLSDVEKQQLVDCCFFAAQSHEGQKRQSGEPYICHPIKVAEILAKEVRFDLPVLQAAVLHDVIEDTPISKDELTEIFGEEVASLVDGVSKLEKDKNISRELLQAKTFEKLVNAMQADPRVVMIKFADRMHNMQTLGALRPDKRKRIANETLEVYVPIATHLGMFIFKTELEELAFKHLYPWRYKTIKHLVKENEKRKAMIDGLIDEIQLQFQQIGITATVRERRRNLLNIYRKLKANQFKKNVRKQKVINASIPFIVLTDSVDECYRALGVIHQFYTPVFHKLTDYIASPRVNGYQSIHTAVLTTDRRVLNFQIRTKEMHSVAESGIVALWRHHNQSELAGGVWRLPQDKSIRRWLKNFKTVSSLSSNSIEFYKAVKRDLSAFDEIQVLTPKGEPMALPKGATVIDFAYFIHRELGETLKTARVNGVEVPPQYELETGQMVELFTDSDACPSVHWLRCVKTARARVAIRHYLRTLPDDVLAEAGYQEIKYYLSQQEIAYRDLHSMLAQIAKQHYQIDATDFLCKIALNEVSYRKLSKLLQELSHHSGMVGIITLLVDNRPKVLSKVTRIISKNKANILRIHFPDDTRAAQVEISFEIHLELDTQLDKIIDSIKALNFVKHIQYEETVQ